MSYVVVVDDQREWRELLRQALSAKGHEVAVYKDGWRALAEVECRRPDCVVLDVRMIPTGGEVLRELRTRWPGLPAIMVSSYGGHAADPDALRASAFMSKKVDIGALADDLERALARSIG
jgi:DNA-binding NtrC family response regulator